MRGTGRVGVWGGVGGGGCVLKGINGSGWHFSNRCDIYNVAKVVHGNRSDNHRNRSDTRPSSLLLELYLA